MKRSKVFDKSIIFIAIIALIIGATVGAIYFQMRTDRISELLSKGEELRTLFIVHEGGKPVLTEVFFYNPKTHKGSILDIPGDVGSIIESLKRVDRIDVLFKESNVAPYLRIIEKLIGIEIPFYVEMSLDNTGNIIDLVEGVEVFIANPVETIIQEKRLLLPSGSVLLDGSKVKTFLTYALPEESELDKISRQQKFMQSLLKTLGEHSTILLNDKVYPFLHGNIRTNLDRRAFAAFLKEMSKLDVERIVFQRVLGVKRSVDNQNLLFPHYDGELLKQTVQQTRETMAKADTMGEEEMNITIELLNGTPVTGLATRTMQLFQSFGFEILVVKNASKNDYANTVVIDRKGNKVLAERVAEVIRCKRVLSELDAGVDPQIQVTVILGKDFDGRYCK